MICCDVNVVYEKDYKFDYQYNPISNRKNTKFYNEYFHTFDIETTYHKSIGQSAMYVWQYYDGQTVILGRTWKEFKHLLYGIRKRNKGYKQVVYVHYLSHEFQYLSGIYDFKPEEVFPVKPRKVLKCDMLGIIELRCSYLLTNMSLDEYTTKMKVKNKKLTGQYDYDKIRTDKTDLDIITELPYCINDVVGLHQAITEEMRLMRDNIISIPLTSTGYVRRDVKKVLYKYRKGLIQKIQPTYAIYKMLREEFSGGKTHASRFYATQLLDDLESMDISSSYPYNVNNCQYPMTRFKNLGDMAENDMHKYDGKAWLFRATFEKIRLKDELTPVPYIMRHKTRGIINEVIDNGCVLSADFMSATFTDIDWITICEQYEWDELYITDFHIAEYGYLPCELKEVVNKYFRDKTELKDVEGQETFYTKSKNLLNSIYGMMATSPFHDVLQYIDNDFKYDEIEESLLYDESLDKQFIVYQWGCWTTCWARRHLYEGINMCDPLKFVYCDTDSVKYLRGGINEKKLAQYNNIAILNSEQSGSFAKDPKGVTHYMGVYEKEKPMKQFITYGAKKYAYVDDKGLHVTISGVSKKYGAEHLSMHGGINGLKLGYVFDGKAGGKNVVYNDETFGWYTVPETGDRIYITKNMAMLPDTYTLGITREYDAIIKYGKLILSKLKEDM